MNLSITYQNGAAHFQTTEVTGVSGSRILGEPVLFVQGRYDFRLLTSHYPAQHTQRIGYELESIQAALFLDHEQVGVAEADLNGPVMIHVGRTEWSGSHLAFRFNFSESTIERLEVKRAGGDIRFDVHLKVRFKELYSLPVTNPGVSVPQVVWGYCQTHHCFGQTRDLTIPKSYWVDRVLRNWSKHSILLELPVIPIKNAQKLTVAYTALNQAVDLERGSHWTEAVSKCRLALESLTEREKNAEGKSVPVLKRSWETRLGKATYDWLDQTIRVLKEPMNKPHHSPEHYFDRVQAKMLLAITASLVAYAANTMEVENE